MFAISLEQRNDRPYPIIPLVGVAFFLRADSHCSKPEAQVPTNKKHMSVIIVSGTVSNVGSGKPGRRTRETTGRLVDIRNQSRKQEINTCRCLIRSDTTVHPTRASTIPAMTNIGKSVDAMKKTVSHRSSPLYILGPHIGPTTKDE